MPKIAYKNKEEVLLAAQKVLGKTLKGSVSEEGLAAIKAKLEKYKTDRKGYFGELVEEYVFGLERNNKSEPDFKEAKVELKSTPIKESTTKKYVSKERLVFSMIDYNEVFKEKWETSSFLEKNKLLLVLFYLYLDKEQSILDYEFKFAHLLDLLADIPTQDIEQIKKDWEFIIAKVGRGEAHLLSEGDTYYLGACTKAANSSIVRDQPMSRVPAKPRAFSLKQTYLNYIIQRDLLGRGDVAPSIYKGQSNKKTIEEVVTDRFKRFIGKTDSQIIEILGLKANTVPKHHRRLLVNQILIGSNSSNIEELDKANITLRVITLEHTGTLKESISFPAFNYRDLVTEDWYDEENEMMSDFHLQLETKRFLFVVFQKMKDSEFAVLKKVMFWNFPMKDIAKAKDVWEKTIDLIDEGKIVKEIVIQKNGKEKRKTYFPGNSFNGVAHVRPHGTNKEDVSTLPVSDQLTGANVYTKQCFWLNAEYIQHAIENHKDQD